MSVLLEALIVMSDEATKTALGRYSRVFGFSCPITTAATVDASTVSGTALFWNESTCTALAGNGWYRSR